MTFNKQARRQRIKGGIRRKIKGTPERPRLSLYKSNRAIYVQVIDDIKGHTLAFAHSFELGVNNNAKVDDSKKLGKVIAQKAKESGIKKVVFDRSGYKYHGKVKALAEGAREGGLEF